MYGTIALERIWPLFVTFVLMVTCVYAIIVFGKDMIHRFYLSRYIPGPTLWETVVTVCDFFRRPFHALRPMCELTERYDFQVWGIWMGVDYFVTVSDLQSIAELFKSKNFDDKWEKFYDILGSYTGRGSLVVNGSKWKRHRAVINPAFKKQCLDELLDVLHEESLELVDKLRTDSQNGCDLDIRQRINEQIIKTAFRSLESRTMRVEDNLSDYCWVIEEATKQTLTRFLSPTIYHHCVYMLKQQNRKVAEKLKRIMEHITMAIYAEKLRILHRLTVDGDIPKQPLEFLLVSTSNKSPDSLMNREVLDEAMTLIGAASETTKTAVSLSILLLALHQDVQSRLIEEIDSVFNNCSGQPATPDNLKKMVYLDMVIKESLRLYPPVPFILRRAKEDRTINEYLIPKGTCVIINIFCLHRNPYVYKDPSKFDPERFSKNGGERKSDSPCAFIPFSYGPRNCVGMRHAMNVLKVYLSTLLRNFRFLPGKGLESVDDIEVLFGVTLSLEECNVRIVRR